MVVSNLKELETRMAILHQKMAQVRADAGYEKTLAQRLSETEKCIAELE